MTSPAAPALNVDWAGVAHPRAESPRIACLVPSLTEALFALGLGERVVARTGFCVHPRMEVRSVPKVGGTKDPDLTRLRELAPTHVIVNIDENRRDVVDAARGFIPNVIVTHPLVPEDNARLLVLLGAIFDRERQADALAREMAAALAYAAGVAARLPRERVLYLIWRKPWMTVSRATYVAATLARVGWDTLPVTAEQRYPTLPGDDAAWRDADRLLVSSEPFAFRARDAQTLAQQWSKPAHLIDGEWTSWYGVRAIAGLHALVDFRAGVAR